MVPQTREDARRLMNEVGRLLGHSRRKVWAEMARRLAERGESVLAWQVVNRLSQMGPMSQKNLAVAVAQHPAGVCRLLEELEAKGLTASERDPEDRRKSRVSITPKGLKWLQDVGPLVTDGIEAALGELPLEEVVLLRGLLLKIVKIAPETAALPARKARRAR